jgi:hypothetical protein
MSRTELPEEVTGSASRSQAMSDNATAAAKWGAQLAAYGLATVAFTFMLLRPGRGAAGGKRGSLFLGSGVLVVLMKTLLSVGETPTAPAPSVPVLAAATPAVVNPPAAAPKRPAKAAAPRHAAVAEKPAQAAPSPAPAATTPVATAPPTAAPAPRPVAPATRPPSPLGSRYADKANGYSLQFPVGWTCKPLKNTGYWVLDATDGQTALMSVGFSKFPANMSVEEIVPEKVSRSLQKRGGAVVHASGYAMLAGRRSLWHKYTGPVTRPEGVVRMTAVHYLLPLQDGRALEVRVAATPEKFNEVAPRMKMALDSLKLLTPVADAGRGR